MKDLDEFISDASGFSAEYHIDGRKVAVRLIGNNKAAFTFFSKGVLLLLIDRAPQYLAAEMLGLKNTEWADEDEPPLDERQFIRRLKLDAVHVYPDHTMRIYYYDSDMFGGHMVVADTDAGGEFSFAGIEG